MRDYYQCHVEAPTSEPSPLTRPPCLWQAGSGQCHDVNQSVGTTRTQTEQGGLTFGNAVVQTAGRPSKTLMSLRWHMYSMKLMICIDADFLDQ